MYYSSRHLLTRQIDLVRGPPDFTTTGNTRFDSVLQESSHISVLATNFFCISWGLTSSLESWLFWKRGPRASEWLMAVPGSSGFISIRAPAETQLVVRMLLDFATVPVWCLGCQTSLLSTLLLRILKWMMTPLSLLSSFSPYELVSSSVSEDVSLIEFDLYLLAFLLNFLHLGELHQIILVDRQQVEETKVQFSSWSFGWMRLDVYSSSFTLSTSNKTILKTK